MNVLIKKNKRDKLITDWLDKTYGDTLIYRKESNLSEWGNFFESDGNKVFLYNGSLNRITLMDGNLESVLEGVFNVKDTELISIFKPWFEKNYNFTPSFVQW